MLLINKYWLEQFFCYDCYYTSKMIYQMTLGLFIDYKNFLVGPKQGPKKTFIQCKTNIFYLRYIPKNTFETSILNCNNICTLPIY